MDQQSGPGGGPPDSRTDHEGGVWSHENDRRPRLPTQGRRRRSTDSNRSNWALLAQALDDRNRQSRGLPSPSGAATGQVGLARPVRSRGFAAFAACLTANLTRHLPRALRPPARRSLPRTGATTESLRPASGGSVAVVHSRGGRARVWAFGAKDVSVESRNVEAVDLAPISADRPSGSLRS